MFEEINEDQLFHAIWTTPNSFRKFRVKWWSLCECSISWGTKVSQKTLRLIREEGAGLNTFGGSTLEASGSSKVGVAHINFCSL